MIFRRYFMSVTVCSLKIMFFFFNPQHAGEQITPRKGSPCIQPSLLAGYFLYNHQWPSGGEGEMAKYFLEKNPQYFLNTLYLTQANGRTICMYIFFEVELRWHPLLINHSTTNNTSDLYGEGGGFRGHVIPCKSNLCSLLN